MLVIAGGAYSGKRSLLRRTAGATHPLLLITAYDGAGWRDVLARWFDSPGHVLALEGWERWAADELQQDGDVLRVRQRFGEFMEELVAAESARRPEGAQHGIILLMLEMGRGVVPVERERRDLRDACGWLLQDAVALADEAWYAWHGLHRVMKP